MFALVGANFVLAGGSAVLSKIENDWLLLVFAAGFCLCGGIMEGAALAQRDAELASGKRAGD